MTISSNVIRPTNQTGSTTPATGQEAAPQATGSPAAEATAAASLAGRAQAQIVSAKERGKGFDSPHDTKGTNPPSTDKSKEEEKKHKDYMDLLSEANKKDDD